MRPSRARRARSRGDRRLHAVPSSKARVTAPGAREPVRDEPARSATSSRRRPAWRRTWRRAMARPRRALFVSSPIGLGHSLRDIAIARELRALDPELEIHWLAQDPVTRVLEARGEHVHPASRLLAGESAHVESEAGEHDLHVFQAWRNMDEILLANFMVLHGRARGANRTTSGDRRRGLGDRPLPPREPGAEAGPVRVAHRLRGLAADATQRPGAPPSAALAADYNAENDRARRPRPRVPGPGPLRRATRTTWWTAQFGPGLPGIREWTSAHYDFPGYVLPFDPAEFADREALRARLGYRRGRAGRSSRRWGAPRSAGTCSPRCVAAGLADRGGDPGGPADRGDGSADRTRPPSRRLRGVELRAFVPDLYAHHGRLPTWRSCRAASAPAWS